MESPLPSVTVIILSLGGRRAGHIWEKGGNKVDLISIHESKVNEVIEMIRDLRESGKV